MPLLMPEMTPLQFLVVRLLFAGPQIGEVLRRKLGAIGIRLSPSSFTRLMERMDRAGYLQLHCRPSAKGCCLARPRCVEVTDLGVAVWTRVREFYALAARPPADLVPIATDEGRLARFPPKVRRAMLRGRTRKQLNRMFRKHLCVPE